MELEEEGGGQGGGGDELWRVLTCAAEVIWFSCVGATDAVGTRLKLGLGVGPGMDVGSGVGSGTSFTH